VPFARLLAAVTLALPALVPGGPGLAHSWYPQRCCNEIDCVKIDSMKRQPDGSLLVIAGHITVIVPPNFPAEPSQDGDAHICTYRDIRGAYLPRCLFVPGEV
jgi:hypothetical protein